MEWMVRIYSRIHEWDFKPNDCAISWHCYIVFIVQTILLAPNVCFRYDEHARYNHEQDIYGSSVDRAQQTLR